MKYFVSVEKRLYSTGDIIVEADTPEEAVEKAQYKIDSGQVKTTSVNWSDPEYEGFSFGVIGEAFPVPTPVPTPDLDTVT